MQPESAGGTIHDSPAPQDRSPTAFKTFNQLVRGAAIHLIDGAGGAQGVDAGRVAAIFKLVQSMTDVAGFPSLLQDFSTWCDKTSKARGVQELVKQMQACSRTQVNVDEIKKLLPGEDSKVGGTGARELFSAAAHCVVKTAELCVDKVGPGIKFTVLAESCLTFSEL